MLRVYPWLSSPGRQTLQHLAQNRYTRSMRQNRYKRSSLTEVSGAVLAATRSHVQRPSATNGRGYANNL